MQSQRQALNLNALNQRQQTNKKVYDTQTVLQLIYQQQHNENSTSVQTPAQQQAAQRYKTELCRTYQENGICKYGDKCQFAHGAGELRNMSRHPKYKTDLCRTFHASGYCPYGPRCHFVHDTQIESRVNKQELSVKLNTFSSSSSSSSSSGSTSPLSLNGFNFDLNTELNSFFPQNKSSSNSLLMYANEFNYTSERKDSISSDSVFGSSSSEGLSSPLSSRSLSPDFFFSNQTQKKFYDDWDYTSTDSIVNQILSNVVCLDEQDKEATQLNHDLTLDYINLATQNLLI
ncbi:unnamed protein product [Brachionus calyciflorus]|uniref:C3H1-type domain-containing protein n=1 Tax=Brachionus calyciflorus TaxID=104777 RepID=A0A813X3R2_9BILA|nr:unnamed protein product [Brachionus calyciflorus]